MDRTAGRREREAGMRRDWLELGFGLLIALAVSGATARAQVGFDRAGGDYASFPMRSGDPAQCATRCERDPRCRAWAFSYPVTESANAVCWLKSRVTPRFAAPCCVSGVRGTGVIEPKTASNEFGVDRNGGDYRQFELPADSSGKAVRRPVKPRKAVAPGPMCGPAMWGLRRSAISRTALPRHCANHAAFPGW